MTRPAFHIRGIPVFMPTSGAIGFGLMSYLALPTAEGLVGGGVSSMLLALLFGATIYLAILIHEIGHAFTARHYGYSVSEIVLTILGGHTLFVQEFKRPKHLALISIAGPALNGLTAIIGFIGLHFSTVPILDSLLLWTVWSTTLMCVINLLPGLPLDGGSVVQAAVWAVTKNPNKAKRAAAIGGVIVAGIWAGSPYLLQAIFGFSVNSVDIAISFFVGMWLAMNAMAILRGLKTQSSEPTQVLQSDFSLNEIVRKTISLDINTTCEEAISESIMKKAGAVIVTVDDKIVGIVREAALASVVESERRTTSIAAVARKLHSEDYLSTEMTSAQFAEIVKHTSTQEWVVRDSAQAIVGVITRADAERRLHVFRS